VSIQPRTPRGTPTSGGRWATTTRPEPATTLFTTDRDGGVGPSATLHAVGFNDEQTRCDRCGRVELRGTVILADDDGNITARMGTTCAARALKAPVTRDWALSREMARRSSVASDLREAKRLTEQGRYAYAAQSIRDARRQGLHRHDELAFVAKLDGDVTRGLAIRAERWGVVSLPGRPPVEADTVAEAQFVARQFARKGGHVVRLDGNQWVPAAS
jgi:hypothetical protein